MEYFPCSHIYCLAFTYVSKHARTLSGICTCRKGDFRVSIAATCWVLSMTVEVGNRGRGKSLLGEHCLRQAFPKVRSLARYVSSLPLQPPGRFKLHYDPSNATGTLNGNNESLRWFAISCSYGREKNPSCLFRSG